ncbi:hypothetical protein DL96DRAFT_1716548 [Flagelloscypha sp. PMI_526]|nr:hypothetical protein DL96DRAFT_1716548 [Flagelloscypha sp. PMI_526]
MTLPSTAFFVNVVTKNTKTLFLFTSFIRTCPPRTLQPHLPFHHLGEQAAGSSTDVTASSNAPATATDIGPAAVECVKEYYLEDLEKIRQVKSHPGSSYPYKACQTIIRVVAIAEQLSMEPTTRSSFSEAFVDYNGEFVSVVIADIEAATGIQPASRLAAKRTFYNKIIKRLNRLEDLPSLPPRPHGIQMVFEAMKIMVDRDKNLASAGGMHSAIGIATTSSQGHWINPGGYFERLDTYIAQREKDDFETP